MGCLQFEDYSKMVYLDADIQVFENVDHLFDNPDGYFYAVMDCFCEKTWSHSRQYSIGYCQQCPDRVTWPTDMGSPPPLYFNAGMFVFEPSRLTCDSLLETLKITPPTPFAEQVHLSRSLFLIRLLLFLSLSPLGLIIIWSIHPDEQRRWVGGRRRMLFPITGSLD